MTNLTHCMMRFVFGNAERANKFESVTRIDPDHSMYIGIPRVRLLNAEHGLRSAASCEVTLYGDLLCDILACDCKDVFKHFKQLAGQETGPNEIYINTEYACMSNLGSGHTSRATWLQPMPAQYKIATVSNEYIKGISYALRELDIKAESTREHILDKVFENPVIAKIEYFDLEPRMSFGRPVCVPC